MYLSFVNALGEIVLGFQPKMCLPRRRWQIRCFVLPTRRELWADRSLGTAASSWGRPEHSIVGDTGCIYCIYTESWVIQGVYNGIGN